MSHHIVGTAGHIDHGKTTLVKALTGTDTDRLPEEKLRKITIDLGFAQLTDEIAIVDVPGHERFVKNMVAGATGIDIALLVVAADDGVMPQTREHLDILHLLGLERGVVAITKCDLVDAEWLALVKSEVTDLLQPTLLDGSELVEVSAVTGEGIEKLRTAIVETAAAISESEKKKKKKFRLPVDRVFTLDGFGTVVTGTVLDDMLSQGDSVELSPSGRLAKVRGLQVHGNSVAWVEAGQRAAINLTGVQRGEVGRGDVVCSPGLMRPTIRVDTKIQLLEHAHTSLKHRQRVRIHLGTGEYLARTSLLEGDQIDPGGYMMVQFHLEKRASTLPGDRFVVRSYSPALTIGGGKILAANPPRHRRHQRSVLDGLRARDIGKSNDILMSVLQESGAKCLQKKYLESESGLSSEVVSSSIEQLISEGLVWQHDSGAVGSMEARKEVRSNVAAILGEFHKGFPHLAGQSLAAIKKSAKPIPDDSTFQTALDDLQNLGEVSVEGGLVRLAHHRAEMTEEMLGIEEVVWEQLMASALSGTKSTALAKAANTKVSVVDDLLGLWRHRDRATHLAEEVWYSQENLDTAFESARIFFIEKEVMEVGDFKNLWGLSRQPTMRLLEYLDRTGLTERVGNGRVLAS